MSNDIDSQEIIEKMKNMQHRILCFLDDETNSEENFQNLVNFFKNNGVQGNRHELSLLLRLILKIGNYHYRFANFFSKIEKILLLYKEDIKKYFSNNQIFDIFKSNKRILLFLFEENFLIFDENIARIITTTKKYVMANYPQYYQPEITPFINKKWFPKYNPNLSWVNIWVKKIKEEELPENFYEKRKKGENEDQLCELIRNDMIKEFIVYINQHNISLNSTIKSSIYETNSILIKNQIKEKNYKLTLIDYAVFFGSLQIFNYLKSENLDLNSSLWYLAIHGQNAEIIHTLEDNHIEPEDKTYMKCFFESLKCHHNDIANYFLNNFLQNENENGQDIFNYCLKNSNFSFLKNEFINEFSFLSLCKYGYYSLLYILLKNKDFDINKKGIFTYYDQKNEENYTKQKTALYLAIEKNNVEIIKLLMTNDKLNVNIQSDVYIDSGYWYRYKKTPLYLAIEKGNIEIIQLLLTNDKIDVNVQCHMEKEWHYEYFKTALFLAIEKGNIEIIQLLMKNDKIDVNVICTKGYRKESGAEIYFKNEEYGYVFYGYEKTALYLAIERGNIEIIQLLMKNDNLNVNVKCKEFIVGQYENGKNYYCYGKGYIYIENLMFQWNLKLNNLI